MEEDLLFISSTVEKDKLAISTDDSGGTGAVLCFVMMLLVTAVTRPLVGSMCGVLLPDMPGVAEWRITSDFPADIYYTGEVKIITSKMQKCQKRWISMVIIK